MKCLSIFIYLSVFLLIKISYSQESIRLNQIGFYPNGPKFAVAVETNSDSFHITSVDLQDTIYTGSTGFTETWSHSGETVKLIDFSQFQQTGEFKLLVEGLAPSYSFRIKDYIYQDISKASIKSYYFQRASTELEEQYAGPWHRAAGHPDDQVLVHASAATEERPVNTVIEGQKGWYDAGDFNKYIVNSGITTYSILAAYEHYPVYYQKLVLNIPESSNDIPDILDEALWNLKWMLKMQDPDDGGVYHKLTHANFSGVVMPNQATAARYVVQKSTPATLDFTAVMAQASRIFKDFDSHMPGFADSCLAAARYAWKWARQNPNLAYNQGTINNNFDPDINTGAYGDGYFVDEFQWASAELFITTKEDSFITIQDPLAGSFGVPSWPDVKTLGLYSLAHFRIQISEDLDTTAVISRLVTIANSLRGEVNGSAYHVAMGVSPGNFVWGSNGVAANQGMALIQAYKITGDETYLEAALQNLDYILGRNATGYCFVTGAGSKPTMNPHHRQSEADDVEDPIPGLLAGGPNPNREDGCSGYLGEEPARSYVDNFCSYASNENAINWNAALVYLAGAVEATYSSSGEPSPLKDEIENIKLPKRTGLIQNYPNPFNPSTKISYWLKDPGNVDLKIYNVSGQLVRTLQIGNSNSGKHIVSWKGDTNNGKRVTSGIYIARLMVKSHGYSITDTKKMIVLR